MSGKKLVFVILGLVALILVLAAIRSYVGHSNYGPGTPAVTETSDPNTSSALNPTPIQ